MRGVEPLPEPLQIVLSAVAGLAIGLWVIYSYRRGWFRLQFFEPFPRKSSPVMFWFCTVFYSLISLMLLAMAEVIYRR